MSIRQRLVEACLIADCPNYAQPGKALCHAHQKRKARDQALEPPIKTRAETPAERLQRVALAYAEARRNGDAVEYRRAIHNLMAAARSEELYTEMRGESPLELLRRASAIYSDTSPSDDRAFARAVRFLVFSAVKWRDSVRTEGLEIESAKIDTLLVSDNPENHGR